MPRAVFEAWLPAPIDRVWADHARPGGLQKMTPKVGRLEMLAPDEGIVGGNLVHFRIVLAGIPILVWKGVYKEVDPPHLFHDIALKSPYRSWSHHHRFIEKDGGTLICDEIEYEMRFGFLGPLADFLVARPMLNGLFRYRHKKLNEMYHFSVKLRRGQSRVEYLEGDRKITIDSEYLAGQPDIVLSSSSLTHWEYPYEGEALTEEEKLRIRRGVLEELAKYRISAEWN